jgi:hypothetical protein
MKSSRGMGAISPKKLPKTSESAVLLKEGGMPKKNWIAGAIKKPGALRKELGAKEGKPIPAKTLAAAAKKPGKVGKRARLAETLKGLKK